MQELGIGLVEVGLFTFVFSGKASLAPNVGPSIATAGLGSTLLEGEPLALRIGSHRFFDAEQPAQVIEVAL